MPAPQPVAALRLVRPAAEHLAGYADALRRGWSPDNVRGAAAAQEMLQALQDDPTGLLALMDHPQGGGPPVVLPDGSRVPRLPSLTRWLWDDEGFAGSIGLRWPADRGALPAHVLGHIGYAVVPWKQRRGYATRALALLLPLARSQGLAFVEITTDEGNLASQRVITRNGGVLVGRFAKVAAHGGTAALRYRIPLGPGGA